MPIQCDHVDGGIAVITIDNPRKHNALDLDMFWALAELWPVLERDPAVRCAILIGAGKMAFCSGADLAADLDRVSGIDDLIDRALLKTILFSKPLIAAIFGTCVAGGLELALAADIRIAANDAKLGLPEVRRGIVPSGGGAMKLCDQIGLAKGMDIILTGRLVSGREADVMGLVTLGCEPNAVWQTALDRAHQIGLNSPNAIIAAKRAALERRTLMYAKLEPIERGFVAQVRSSGDPTEGKAAFLERRQPIFGAALPELLAERRPLSNRSTGLVLRQSTSKAPLARRNSK